MCELGNLAICKNRVDHCTSLVLSELHGNTPLDEHSASVTYHTHLSSCRQHNIAYNDSTTETQTGVLIIYHGIQFCNMQNHKTPSCHTERKKLHQQLEAEMLASQKLQQQLSDLQIQSQIQMENQKQEQWSLAINKIKEIQTKAKEEHGILRRNIQELIQISFLTVGEETWLTTPKTITH